MTRDTHAERSALDQFTDEINELASMSNKPPRPEKCTGQIPPIRVTEETEKLLNRLAARDERTLSEYVRMVLTRHVFGHAASVSDSEFGGY